MAGNTLMKLLIEIGLDSAPAQKGLKGVEKDAKAAGSGITNSFGSAQQSMRSFISTTGAVIGAFSGIAYAIQSVVNQTVEYYDQIRNTSRLLGTSVEEAARVINVTDDVFISYENMTVAMKIAQKNGIEPTIEGLANLADQYEALPKGMERTQFLLKTFGKNGVEMGKLMEKGGDGVHKMSAAIDDSLIPTQDAIDKAEDYKIAQDQLSDSMKAVSNTLGNILIPIETKALDIINSDVSAMMNLDGAMQAIEDRDFGALADWAAGILNGVEASKDLAKESRDAAGGQDDLTTALEEAEKAAKAASKANEGLLSSMFDITKNARDYRDTQRDLDKDEQDLKDERARAAYEFFQASEEQKQHQADLTEEIGKATSAEERHKLAKERSRDAAKFLTDEEVNYYIKLQEIDEKIAEVAAKRQEAAVDNKKAASQRVYDLTKERLAADGIIDSGEAAFLADIAVKRGLITQAAAYQAVAEAQEADKLVANFSKTQPVMDTALTTMRNIAAFDGKMVNFGVNFTQTGATFTQNGGAPMMPNLGAGSAGGRSASSSTSKYWASEKRDSGGSGMAGTPYLIGTGAQPEMFTPSTNGTFTPANKMGGTTVINVYNPKKETAENSIRNELKKLSYTGAAA